MTIHHGDALAVLRTLPDASVNCCVTSPPYYGLRNYNVAGQIGLEKTPAEYIARLVDVFREVRRVLADDGTLWVNIGDSYASGKGKCYNPGGNTSSLNVHLKANNVHPLDRGNKSTLEAQGLKPKDLIGIPWMLAFALRDDGWWLRQDIIWAKPNPMPESVKDRCTKAHEYIFMLSKSARYWWDAGAISEPATHAGKIVTLGEKSLSKGQANGANVSPNGNGCAASVTVKPDRNRRSVWTLATLPTPEAHFATYPIELPELCIRAGCPPEGKRCDCDELIESPLGSGVILDPSMETGRAGMNRPRRPDEGTRPITRREQRDYARQMRESSHRREMEGLAGEAFAHYIRTDRSGARPLPPQLLNDWLSRGWLNKPAPCDCPIEPAGVVLDPFTGAGTTALACLKNGRRFVGVELNAEYIEIAQSRARKYYPLLCEATA